MIENPGNNTPKTAVLLVNMGAPVSEQGMKVFLRRLFRDKAIVQAPEPVRRLLAATVSRMRYKSSWRKYLTIGGSPLLNSMNKTAAELQKLLSSNYQVRCAFSYSVPFIENEITELTLDGFEDFVIISMYPQSGFTTTGSIAAVLKRIQETNNGLRIRFVEDYHDNPFFVQLWTNLIIRKIAETGYRHPILLFSAHAIPQSGIKRGDSYPLRIQKSAQLIADALNLPYRVGYQSKLGPVKWTEPSTSEVLKKLSANNASEIIIVPLSFVNENLETCYDLDIKLIPYSINILKIGKICRIHIPESDNTLVRMYRSFIEPY